MKLSERKLKSIENTLVFKNSAERKYFNKLAKSWRKERKTILTLKDTRFWYGDTRFVSKDRFSSKLKIRNLEEKILKIFNNSIKEAV